MLDMPYEHAVGVYDVYKLDLCFDKSGLYWYNFIVDIDSGGSFTVPEYTGGGYQITVFDPDSARPDWLWGGMIYHIFVDRFNSSGEVTLRQGAVRRNDWGGCPYFLPDEKGIVRNCDFFGGNLYGIIEKLPYLDELGVTCIYLSPIFEADSNHKYDTGDFLKVDNGFGGDEALEELCFEAGKLGIKVILDGVFNHVGSNSVYFNRYGKYDGIGAYQDVNSPYYDWFFFNEDGSYDSWWDIELLPAVNETNPRYKHFLCNSDDGVIAKWMRKGVSGWRLDVVDELPDSILDPLCAAIRRENKNAYIVGEVWEDASHKIAYGVRRRYFLGGQLDSVTNYPLKNSIIAFIKDGDVNALANTMSSLCRNYPKNVLDSLMNILGTHDTMRILSVLSGLHFPDGKLAMSHFKLSDDELAIAKKRLKLAAALQFTLPGIPCVYYADEAGMEGGADPFNRVCYPWGHEDMDLISWYMKLSKIRKRFDCFKDGKYTLLEARAGLFAFTRGDITCDYTGNVINDTRVLIAVNISDTDKTVNACGFDYDLLENKQIDTPVVKAGEAGIFVGKGLINVR